MAVKARTRDEALRVLAFAEQRYGYPLNITAEKWKPERSSPQNSYLFGIAYPPIRDVTGYEIDGPNGIHTYMLGTHFGWKERKCPKTPSNPTGIESVPVRTTTTDENGKRSVLQVGPFSEFIETVLRIGAMAGAFVPSPEPSDMQPRNPRSPR